MTFALGARMDAEEGFRLGTETRLAQISTPGGEAISDPGTDVTMSAVSPLPAPAPRSGRAPHR